jgi:tetratricopeptide (TPR) repeat protein
MNKTTFEQLWNFDQPAETELKFRALVPEAEKSGNKEYHLQLLTQIARTEGLQSKFEEAHVTLDEVQEAITPETPIAKIRYFLERGRIFNSLKQPELALPLFERAYTLALESKEESLSADAAQMIATTKSDANKQID